MSSSEGRRERTLSKRFPYSPIYYGAGINKGKVAIAGGSQLVNTGRQITVSENHVYNQKSGHYDAGGPFYTDKLESIHSPVNARISQGTGENLTYNGPVFCPLPTKSEIEKLGLLSSWTNPRSEKTDSLDPLGATAISQCSPVNPVTNLSASLAETRTQGLPSLPGVQAWKKKVEIAKGAAGEILNAAFGWAPLIGEVKNFRDSVTFHSEIMKQYRRDEGKNVRRDFHFPIDKSSAGFVTSGSSENFEVHTGRFSAEPAVRSVSLQQETRKWFVGCFTYGVPHQTDSWSRHLGYASEANKLFGVSLTPDVLWELTPWSWAIDWFTNAGDVINNVTNWALAGQVMRYGYMMEESITKIDVSLSHPGYYNTKGQAGPSCSRIHTSKVRRPANPFGFGLTPESLSPLQQLIAVSVGITRL